MAYENRFDGRLNVTPVSDEDTVEIPDELRTQAEALGLVISPKTTVEPVADIAASLRLSDATARFFYYYKYDEKTNSILPIPGVTAGSFYEFEKNVRRVAVAFYDAGYRLSGEVYRLGEDRDDVERAKVNGRDVEVEQADVVFTFKDGSMYSPPPL